MRQHTMTHGIKFSDMGTPKHTGVTYDFANPIPGSNPSPIYGGFFIDRELE